MSEDYKIVCNVVCVTSYHELMLRFPHVRLSKRCASIATKFLFAISSLNFLHIYIL
jgi:hypothetical protein